MQNSAVIIKVEYRLIKDVVSEFMDLDIIPYSGSISETVSCNKAGHLHSTTIKFNIAKVNVTADDVLKSIRNIPAQVRVSDANGNIHLIGDDIYRCRLTYQKVLEGSPGSFNGYRCTMLCDSATGNSFL